MRRQFFEHSELLLFCVAWGVALLSAWADSQDERRPSVDRRAAVAPAEQLPDVETP